MKYATAALGVLLYVAVLIVVYFLHMRFFKVDVVFYSSVADGVLSAIIAFALMFALKGFRSLSGLEKTQLLAIWLLLGYSFAISVPTVIDRSLSFYFLEKVDQRGGGIKLAAFEKVFTEEYAKEHRLVDVRLTEQIKSGTLYIDGSCVKITDRGRTLAEFSRFFRQHFLPRQRLLMGEYTDDLTDPFRGSSVSVDYSCR